LNSQSFSAAVFHDTKSEVGVDMDGGDGDMDGVDARCGRVEAESETALTGPSVSGVSQSIFTLN